MSTINLITNNKYIDAMTKLFDIMYNEYDQFNTNRKDKLAFKNKVNEHKKYMLSIYRELQTHDLDYDGLRKFADFITYLEKVFIYKNDKEVNSLICINPTDSDKRTMYIKEKDANIEIQISAFFDYSNMNEEAVEILIKRNTGRQINNQWVVYNGKVNDKLDTNDIVSISVINYYMRKLSSELFYSFMNLILERKILDFEYRNEVGL